MLQRSMKIYMVFLLLSVTELVIATPPNNTAVDQFVCPGGPFAIASTPDGLHLYISNRSNDTVSVVQTSDNTIIDTITLTTGSQPEGIVVTPDGAHVYVALSNSSQVNVIQTSDNTIISVISTGVGSSPFAIAITPDGAHAYVSNQSGNNVNVIRISDNTVINIVPVGNSPAGLVITPDGSHVYVANYGVTGGNSTVSVIQTSDNTVSDTIVVASGTAQPSYLVVTPNGQYVYVTLLNAGNITVIQTSDNSIFTTITGLNNFEPSSLAMTPDGSTIYAIDVNNQNIEIFETATNLFTGLVDPSSYDMSIVSYLTTLPVAPYMYVADGSLNTVTVVYTFIPISPPSSIVGLSQSDVFFTQTDYINTITWTAPTSGETPVSYQVYSDEALTQLLATIPATDPLQYFDHNRIPGTTYNYYVVSVNDTDALSSAINVSVTTLNN